MNEDRNWLVWKSVQPPSSFTITKYKTSEARTVFGTISIWYSQGKYEVEIPNYWEKLDTGNYIAVADTEMEAKRKAKFIFTQLIAKVSTGNVTMLHAIVDSKIFGIYPNLEQAIAGLSLKYGKNYSVLDWDGTLKVVFTDKYGRTIATAVIQVIE